MFFTLISGKCIILLLLKEMCRKHYSNRVRQNLRFQEEILRNTVHYCKIFPVCDAWGLKIFVSQLYLHVSWTNDHPPEKHDYAKK